MYQILIETALSDLLIVLLKNDQILSFVHKKNLIKKAEVLPNFFKQIISQNNLKVREIKKFYITLGPGSFMGSRTALVFARTICQITGASLYVTNTLKFISNNLDGKYYIDAKSNQSYQGIVKNNHLDLAISNYNLPTKINYQKILEHISQYLLLFEKNLDLLAISPVYLKNPQVG